MPDDEDVSAAFVDDSFESFEPDPSLLDEDDPSVDRLSVR